MPLSGGLLFALGCVARPWANLRALSRLWQPNLNQHNRHYPSHSQRQRERHGCVTTPANAFHTDDTAAVMLPSPVFTLP